MLSVILQYSSNFVAPSVQFLLLHVQQEIDRYTPVAILKEINKRNYTVRYNLLLLIVYKRTTELILIPYRAFLNLVTAS